MRSLLLSVLLLATLSGAQEIRRPTAETNTSVNAKNFCSGTWYSGTLPNFWDGSGVVTKSSTTAGGTSGTSQRFKATQIYGFAPPSGSYSALTLNVEWACPEVDGGGCAVSYSTNGGSDWTIAESTGTITSSHTTSITLSPTQDLTQLRVQWEVCGDYGSSALNSTIYGFDIRTEGVLKHHRSQVISTE